MEPGATGPAQVGLAGPAPIAGTAPHVGLHRDRCAVVEHTGEFVAQRHRQVPRREVQVGRADAARTHAHAHRVGRVHGRGHVDIDDRHASVPRRPHRSHAGSLAGARPGSSGADATTVWSVKQRTRRGATMADLGFDGRVAIVTGAGGGLGREHALLLAGRGAMVVVNDVGGAVDGTGGDAGPGQQVVDEIAAAGGEAVLDTNSVATPEGGAAIVQTALDSFGRIDIVVNNAGILRDKSFHNMTPDLVDPVIDVHLQRRVLRHPAGMGAHARAVVRAHRGHRVVGRHVRQLRPGQLRRRQDGTRRTRPRARPGGRARTTSRSTRSRRRPAPA